MLPPFVPPSARSASEHLPLITDYVIDRVERSFGATFAMGTSEPEGAVLTAPEPSPRAEEAAPASSMVEVSEVETAQETSSALVSESGSGGFIVGGIEYSATLPSIEDFVLRTPYTEPSGTVSSSTVADLPDESPFVQLSRHSPDLPSAAESSQMANTQPAKSETAPATTTSPAPSTPQSPATPPTNGDWVEAERNSFDWQSVATLAAPADEAERAAQEWMATDWDTPSASPPEYVAAILMQLARRVRSGDLAIEAVRGMSREAALAAVLTALLSEPDKAR